MNLKHLILDYYLDTDNNNYILCQRKIRQGGKNKGSEYFDEVAYFGQNIVALQKRLIDIYVQQNIQNKSYEELLAFCKEVIELKEKLD